LREGGVQREIISTKKRGTDQGSNRISEVFAIPPGGKGGEGREKERGGNEK